MAVEEQKISPAVNTPPTIYMQLQRAQFTLRRAPQGTTVVRGPSLPMRPQDKTPSWNKQLREASSPLNPLHPMPRSPQNSCFWGQNNFSPAAISPLPGRYNRYITITPRVTPEELHFSPVSQAFIGRIHPPYGVAPVQRRLFEGELSPLNTASRPVSAVTPAPANPPSTPMVNSPHSSLGTTPANTPPASRAGSLASADATAPANPQLAEAPATPPRTPIVNSPHSSLGTTPANTPPASRAASPQFSHEDTPANPQPALIEGSPAPEYGFIMKSLISLMHVVKPLIDLLDRLKNWGLNKFTEFTKSTGIGSASQGVIPSNQLGGTTPPAAMARHNASRGSSDGQPLQPANNNS